MTPQQRARISAAQRALHKSRIEAFDPLDSPETKRCTKCGDEKPLVAFYHRKKKLKTGFVFLSPMPSCRECIKRAARARHQSLTAAQRQRRRAYEERYRKENVEKLRTYRREWETARRREKGSRSRELGPKERINAPPFFPTAPIAALLSEERRDIATISAATGLDPRQLNGIMRCERATTALATIDAILVGLGRPEMLSILYPEPDLSVGYHYLPIEEATKEKAPPK